MKPLLVVALVLSIAASPMMASDNPFDPAAFNTDAAVVAAAQGARNSFVPDAPRKAAMSKTKVGVIAAIAGAVVVVGILLAKGSAKGSGTGSSSPVPPPSGTGGSILVINGVPQ